MTAREVAAIISGSDEARIYLRGIEEGSEAAHDAERALLAAIYYMRGAGVHDAMAVYAKELYAQCAFMIMGDWTENTGNAYAEGGTQIPFGARQIISQLRYDKKHNVATEEET